jgi:hypothetical protein
MRNDGLKVGKDGAISSAPIEELVKASVPMKGRISQLGKVQTVSPYRFEALKKIMRG